jgi:hypothetical protein
LKSDSDNRQTGYSTIDPKDGTATAQQHGDIATATDFVFPWISGVSLFWRTAYFNPRAGVNPSKSFTSGSLRGWDGLAGVLHVELSLSCFLFSGHLAWRFSGEEEKAIYPFFTALPLYPFCFPFRYLIIVGR